MYTPIINTLDIQDLLNIRMALLYMITEDFPNKPVLQTTLEKIVDIENKFRYIPINNNHEDV